MKPTTFHGTPDTYCTGRYDPCYLRPTIKGEGEQPPNTKESRELPSSPESTEKPSDTFEVETDSSCRRHRPVEVG